MKMYNIMQKWEIELNELITKLPVDYININLILYVLIEFKILIITK